MAEAVAARAIVVLSLSVTATWLAGCPAGQPRSAGATVAQRVIVAPGDDLPPLAIDAAGASWIEVDREGTLLVHRGDAVLRQQPPRAYQEINGTRNTVVVRFDIPAAGAPRIVAGAYDRTLPLVIESVPPR